MAILLLIVGLFLFIGLVVVHEFGHFLAARRAGVDVEEFGIFFPPALYKRKTKGGWIFSINAIPLGGFVKLKGEHDSDTEPGSFGAASLSDKTKIMAAGVFMNLVVALVLFTILALIGIPKLIPNQFTVAKDTHLHTQTAGLSYYIIDQVEAGSAAQKAGIRKGDHVTAIGKAGHLQTIAAPDDLTQFTKKYAGQTIALQVNRKNQKLTISAKLPTKEQVNASMEKGYLGVVITPQIEQVTLLHSTWSAPVVALGLSAQITSLTFQGLAHAIGGLGSIVAGAATGNTTAREHGQSSASSQVAGPVGIFIILKDGSALGYQYMLLIIAIISLTLAIMNILPIPALDGGRLWITLAARLVRQPLSAPVEEAINLAGFVLLISLIVLVTFVDVKRFF